MSRVSELVRLVKGFLEEWENGGAAVAVEQARACPCGCPFRHRHGSYTRFVLVVSQEYRITIPRLLCPVCVKTVAVLPGFLAPRSPHPWCVREAAVAAQLAGPEGYRRIAAGLALAWQLVWAWVEALARRARELLVQLLALVLRYPGPEGIGASLPGGWEVDALRARARSPAKRESLACLAGVFTQTHLLWRASGLRREPGPGELLGFVHTLREALD